jgi:hypothetical protein
MSGAMTLILPGLLAAGLVLIMLGLTGRDPRRAPARRWPPRRLAEWMVQAGLHDTSIGVLVAFCIGLGLLTGLVVLAISGSIWIGAAFTVLAGYLPVLILRPGASGASASSRTSGRTRSTTSRPGCGPGSRCPRRSPPSPSADRSHCAGPLPGSQRSTTPPAASGSRWTG